MFCRACFSIYMVLRHSPGKRWLLDLLVSCIYFYILIFAYSLFFCVICIQFGVLIVSFFIVALVLPDLAPFLLSVQAYLVQFF